MLPARVSEDTHQNDPHEPLFYKKSEEKRKYIYNAGKYTNIEI
jgi:hypothetical protein